MVEQLCMVTQRMERAGWQLDILPGYSIFGKNVLQLTDDLVKRLKSEYASNDPNVILSYVPIQDDHMKRPVEFKRICSTTRI